MKRSPRNYLIVALIFTLIVLISFSCATKTKSTQPSGTEDQEKPASASSSKAQEATPPPTPTTGPTTAPTPAPSPTPTTTPPPPPPSKTPEPSPSPALQTTEIALPFVNLRQGPSIDSKIITVLKKGTQLTVLEEKKGWLHVRLEDGTEGWVGKSMTSEGTQPPPAAPTKSKGP